MNKINISYPLGKFVLVGMFIVLMLATVLNVDKIANANEVEDIVINPVPQSLIEKGEGFPLTDTVNLVIGNGTNRAVIEEVESILKSAHVKEIKQSNEDDSLPQTGTTIYLGGVSENEATINILKELNITGPEELKEEGYVLVTGVDKDDHHKIVLAGKDQAGTFYAAQTFKQLIQERSGDFSVPAVEIRDWPEMPIRGTIEGFYGPPWTHEDRLNQLKFYGENKMNTYIYAPKDDPYHRDKWREPYPEAELKELQDLVNKANEEHVNFTFGISPGNTICFSDDSDFDALLAKAEAVWDLGVRSYAIFLDDIDPTLRCAADIGKFQGERNPSAAAQAYLLNRFNEEFLEDREEAMRLITVPTDYSGNGTTVYREQFAESVDDDIVIMWTGDKVVSEEITSEGAEQVWNIFQHDLLVWDNYPVNDFDRESLFLGPLVQRSKDLTDHGVVGLTANPMNEAEASKISLYTIADYTWNPVDYVPENSWERSIKSLGGAGADVLRRFAENSYSSPINNKESLTLTPLIEAFWQAYELGGAEEAATDLIAEFKQLEQISNDLEENIDNKKLLLEIAPYVEKLQMYGEAGEMAVKYLEAIKKEQTDQAREYQDQLIDLFNQTEQIPQKISGDVIRPFLIQSILRLPPLELTLESSITAFEEAYELGDAMTEATDLMSEFSVLKQIAEEVYQEIDNDEFLQVAKPYLNNLEIYGSAGEVAVQYVMALKNDEADEAIAYKEQLKTLLVEVQRMPQLVGEQVIKPFLINSMWDSSVVAYRVLDGINRSRGEGQLIQYTPSYGDRTRTNNWGYEVSVEEDIVVSRGGNDLTIPRNGYVLSIHGDDWLRDYTKVGTHIQIEDGMILARESEVVELEIDVKMNDKDIQENVTLSSTESAVFTWEVVAGGNGSGQITATFAGEEYTEGTIIDLAGKAGEHQFIITVTDKTGNKHEESYNINVTTDVADLQSLIGRYTESDDIKNAETARALQLHLTALKRYEDQNLPEKLIKHLEGFQTLLDHQNNNEVITEQVYEVLSKDAEYLINKWK